jgi:hypothetical protein
LAAGAARANSANRSIGTAASKPNVSMSRRLREFMFICPTLFMIGFDGEAMLRHHQGIGLDKTAG